MIPILKPVSRTSNALARNSALKQILRRGISTQELDASKGGKSEFPRDFSFISLMALRRSRASSHSRIRVSFRCQCHNLCSQNIAGLDSFFRESLTRRNFRQSSYHQDHISSSHLYLLQLLSALLSSGRLWNLSEHVERGQFPLRGLWKKHLTHQMQS